MTWLTTWPANGRPQFAEHPTEAKAEAHATELVNSRRADVATVFWSSDETNGDAA